MHITEAHTNPLGLYSALQEMTSIFELNQPVSDKKSCIRNR